MGIFGWYIAARVAANAAATIQAAEEATRAANEAVARADEAAARAKKATARLKGSSVDDYYDRWKETWGY
jgi:hypothetical protein